jgi:hypothetical protein
MPALNVMHLLYSRVEADYSPIKRREGYQIVYQSPGLEKDATTIEKHIQCFEYGGEDIERFQYFTTESGRAVVSHTTPLLGADVDRTVIDRNGRPGPFITHCYVMEPDQFALIGNDPIALFEKDARWITTVERLVAVIKQEEIPPSTVKVPERRQFTDSLDWTQEELAELSVYVERADALLSKKQSLLLMGDPEEIYDLVSFVLFFCPKELRHLCTFDTHVTGCNPQPGQYWAVGSSKRISNSGFVPVTLDTHHIDQKSGALPDPKVTPYSIWLRHSLKKSGERLAFVNGIFTAQSVANAFATNVALPNLPPDMAYDTQAFESFRTANSDLVNKRVETALQEALDKPIVQALLPKIYELDKVGVESVLNAAAVGKYPTPMLADIVYRWLVADKPDVKNWGSLRKFAEDADHPALLLLSSIKSHHNLFSNTDKQRREALNALATNGNLERVMNQLAGLWIEIADFVTAHTARQVVDFAAHHRIGDKDFKELVKAILTEDCGQDLDPLAEQVGRIQDKKVLKELAHAIEKKAVAPRFVQSLQQSLHKQETR